jgi:hypothetical protein
MSSSDKWEIWKSFDNWRLSNANRLSKDYDYLRGLGKLDNVCYEDYVGGIWQNNDL